MQQTQRVNQQQMQQSQLQQEPTAAEINLMLNSLGLGLPPNETLQLANWDLKKLAMYLVSRQMKTVSSILYILNHLNIRFIHPHFLYKHSFKFV